MVHFLNIIKNCKQLTWMKDMFGSSLISADLSKNPFFKEYVNMTSE